MFGFKKQPLYYDIHCHLDFKDYDLDREEVIKIMKQERVSANCVGVNLETSKACIKLANSHDNIYAIVGIHPVDDPKAVFDDPAFSDMVKNQKVVAIGECGLDYARLHYESDDEKKRQKSLFEQQIEFAVAHNKPLMIHCRDAFLDCLTLLQAKKRQYGDKLRGNFHFFTSTIENAAQCFDIGFTISFTGPITYGGVYDDLVTYAPLEKIMAETDAPFAAPVPYRGQRNNPLYIREIVDRIAEIKEIDVEVVKAQLLKNAFDLFLSKNS